MKKLKDKLSKSNKEINKESDENMHLTTPSNLLNSTRKEELKINLNGENSLKPSYKYEDSKVSHTLGQPSKYKSENGRKRINSGNLLTPDLPPSLPPIHPRKLSEINIIIGNHESPPSDGINENNEERPIEKSIEKPEVIVKR
jgi:hypothetical protein